MGIKVTNNAFGALTAGITTGDTTIVLGAGEGVRFPALGSGDFFFGTLIDTGNNLEIVRVTARSVDTMTIVRGQDGTTARAFSAGDRFELRPTAAMFQAFTQADGIAYDNTASGLSATTAQAALDELESEKQDTLVSGTNLKTVGGQSLLGAGNITAGGNQITQIFTAPGTWTKPAELKAIKVTVVGGGGNGGAAPATPKSQTRFGGGGAAGGTAIRWISAPTIPGPVAVTRGAAGGTSSFGAFASATGGSTGTANISTARVAGGTATAPGGAEIRGNDSPGVRIFGTADGSGEGAPTTVGTGGRVRTTTGTGNAGGGFGSGGGGGAKIEAAPVRPGGAGAPGVVIVEEFY
jgi:hypothetical protein